MHRFSTSVYTDRARPIIDAIAEVVEKFSSQAAPDELHPSKTSGYLLLALGGGSVVAGLGFILLSRKK